MPGEEKKLNIHKVLSTIGIILSIVIVIIAAIWFYINQNTPQNIETDNVKISTTSAKKATISAEVDETANWKELSNATVGYLLKYPENWLLNGTSAKEAVCDDDSVFLAPTKELLGLCASGYSGLIYIARTTVGDTLEQQVSFHKESDYENFQKSDVVVDGKNAIKITGTSIVSNEFINKVGQKEIIYLIDLGDRVLILGYYQPKTVQDYSETFEKIITTIKFI